MKAWDALSAGVTLTCGLWGISDSLSRGSFMLPCLAAGILLLGLILTAAAFSNK